MLNEVQPGVFWFHPPSGSEVYLVHTQEGLVLIDAGFPVSAPALAEALRDGGFDPADVRLAIATHQHGDHVAGLAWWHQEYGVPVLAHAEDAEAIVQGDPLKTCGLFPYLSSAVESYPCPVARHLVDGDEVTLGERTLTIIHAPGHTPGCILIRVGDALITGDVVAESGALGWMDVHWGSNPMDYAKTLDAMHAFTSLLACPGHGAPFTLSDRQLVSARDHVAFYLSWEHGFPAYPRR